MSPHLEARAVTLLRDGRRTLDVVALRWGCPACGAEEWDAQPRPQNPDAPTPDLLAALVDGLAAIVAATPPPRCACGAEREAREVTRHVHHGDRGLDLVVARDAGATRLAWWDPRTGRNDPLDALDPADAGALARDGLLRHLDGRLAVADGAGFCDALERGATDHAGDPLLLALVGEAARHGERGRAVAEALLVAHREAPRADAEATRRAAVEAHLAAARLEVEGARAGLEVQAALERAQAALDEALALDPDHVEAALLRASVLRGLGAPEAARDALEAFVTRQPVCAQALVALGQLLLELGQAEPALRRFVAAAAAQPDADAALGEARALLRLGRADEAAAAAERGRVLDAEHPRLGPIEHELARRLGREPADGERVVVDVVGLDVFGEAALERGVQRLVDLGVETPTEGAATERLRLAAWDLCCKLRIVDGQALVRGLDGRPERLWRVVGDGRCCTVMPHDDPDALADFAGEFDALWAEEGR